MTKTKKILAVVLTAAMAIAPTTVFAADIKEATGSAVTGAGSSAGWVETEVIQYELTTGTLNFKIDPQGLLSVPNDGTETATLSNEGDIQFGPGSALKVKNKSSVDIGVNVTASITSNDDNLNVVTDVANFVTNSKYKTATDTSICISTTTTPAATGIDGISKTGTVIGAAMENAKSEYVYKNDSGSYSYVLKGTPVDANFKVFEIGFTGKVSAKGDWSSYATNTKDLGLKVVYEVDKLDSSVSVTNVTVGGTEVKFATASTPTYSKASGGKITVDTTKNTISNIKYGPSEDNIANTMTGYSFDSTTHVVTLPSGLFKSVTAGQTGYIQVTYGNGSTDVFTVTVQN